MIKRKYRNYIGKAFAYIILIFAVVIALLPIIWIASSSLNTSNSLMQTSGIIPKGITLKHYKELLTGDNGRFLLWLKNSLIVAGCTVLLSIITGVTAAYAFSRYRFKSRRAMLNSLLLLNAFPSLLYVTAFFKILKTFKLYDNLLGLVLVYTGTQLVFSIWNLKGYFDTIPVEIEEAAMIDGASKFRIFINIILPLSKPALAVTAILSFMAGWNEYILAATLTNNSKLFTLPVGIWSLQNAGEYAKNWPLFSAGSLLVAIPVIIVFLALQKYFISGLTMGSSK